MAGGSTGLIFTGSVAAEAENCILLEIMIIVISPVCVFASTWPEALRPFFAGSLGLFPIFTYARV